MAKQRRQLTVYDEFGVGDQERQSLGEQGARLAAAKVECQAWLAALHKHCQGSNQDEFFKLLRGSCKSSDQTVKVLNQSRQWIAKVFPFSHGSSAGEALAGGAAYRARCCQYLYNRTLFKLMTKAIQHAAQVQDLAPKAVDAVVKLALEDEELLAGLLNSCIEVVNFAFVECAEQLFPTKTIQLGRMCQTLELWQAIDWLTALCGDADAAAGIPALPNSMRDYLAAVQTRIEEELAFSDGSTIYKRMVALEGSQDIQETVAGAVKKRRRSPLAAQHEPKEGPGAALMARFMPSLCATAMARTALVCRGLAADYPELTSVPDLATKCCTVVDLALFDHLELLFNQHLSVVIAASIYYTLRLHDVTTVSFRKITGYMAATLINHSEQTFSHVEIPSKGGCQGNEIRVGDTREFYNCGFLPAMKDYTAAELFGDISGAASVGGDLQPGQATHMAQGLPGAATSQQQAPAATASQPLRVPQLQQRRGQAELEAPLSGAHRGPKSTVGGSKGVQAGTTAGAAGSSHSRRSSGGAPLAGAVADAKLGGAAGRKPRKPLSQVQGNQACG